MRGTASRTCPFSVNVPYELLEIIADSKHLEVLGFHLPELARNVALQEDRYRRHSVNLAAMIDRFNSVLSCMTDPEVRLSANHKAWATRGFKWKTKTVNW